MQCKGVLVSPIEGNPFYVCRLCNKSWKADANTPNCIAARGNAVPDGYVEECEESLRYLANLLHDVRYDRNNWRQRVEDFSDNGIRIHPPSSKTAPDHLEAAARTFRERNALYGSNYQRQGALLLALFPEGGIPAITTPEDANRLHVFVACVTKLQRYAHNWSRGGHQDSAHDLMVYAAMLEEHTK